MTVRELIAQLQMVEHQDAEVYTIDCHNSDTAEFDIQIRGDDDCWTGSE